MKVFFNGQYLELEQVRISPFDRGFQYADGVYEVMRTYFGKLFRASDHFERLKESLKQIRIKYSEVDQLENVIYRLIELNQFSGKDVSAYIQITRGEFFPRRHSFPPENVKPTVFVSVSVIHEESRSLPEGIKLIIVKDIRWSRCDIKSISLLPGVLANQHAVDEGAEEAIWERDGILYEGSHTNFWAVKDGIVYTAPLSNYILPGISRKVVIEVCRENSIRVTEEAVRKDELKSFDEFFITGTTTEVKPVIRIENWKIGGGKPGKITERIYSLLINYIEKKEWIKSK